MVRGDTNQGVGVCKNDDIQYIEFVNNPEKIDRNNIVFNLGKGIQYV